MPVSIFFWRSSRSVYRPEIWRYLGGWNGYTSLHCLGSFGIVGDNVESTAGDVHVFRMGKHFGFTRYRVTVAYWCV